MFDLFTKRPHFGEKKYRVELSIFIKNISFSQNEHFIKGSTYTIFHQKNKKQKITSRKNLLSLMDLNKIPIEENLIFNSTLYKDSNVKIFEHFLPKERNIIVRQCSKIGNDSVYKDLGIIILSLHDLVSKANNRECFLDLQGDPQVQAHLEVIVQYRFLDSMTDQLITKKNSSNSNSNSFSGNGSNINGKRRVDSEDDGDDYVVLARANSKTPDGFSDSNLNNIVGISKSASQERVGHSIELTDDSTVDSSSDADVKSIMRGKRRLSSRKSVRFTSCDILKEEDEYSNGKPTVDDTSMDIDEPTEQQPTNEEIEADQQRLYEQLQQLQQQKQQKQHQQHQNSRHHNHDMDLDEHISGPWDVQGSNLEDGSVSSVGTMLSMNSILSANSRNSASQHGRRNKNNQRRNSDMMMIDGPVDQRLRTGSSASGSGKEPNGIPHSASNDTFGSLNYSPSPSENSFHREVQANHHRNNPQDYGHHSSSGSVQSSNSHTRRQSWNQNKGAAALAYMTSQSSRHGQSSRRQHSSSGHISSSGGERRLHRIPSDASIGSSHSVQSFQSAQSAHSMHSMHSMQSMQSVQSMITIKSSSGARHRVRRLQRVPSTAPASVLENSSMDSNSNKSVDSRVGKVNDYYKPSPSPLAANKDSGHRRFNSDGMSPQKGLTMNTASSSHSMNGVSPRALQRVGNIAGLTADNSQGSTSSGNSTTMSSMFRSGSAGNNIDQYNLTAGSYDNSMQRLNSSGSVTSVGSSSAHLNWPAQQIHKDAHSYSAPALSIPPPLSIKSTTGLQIPQQVQKSKYSMDNEIIQRESILMETVKKSPAHNIQPPTRINSTSRNNAAISQCKKL